MSEKLISTKICTKCKEEKELSFFRKDKTKADGYYSSCALCKDKQNALNADIKKLYSQKYWIKNKDKLTEYNKQSYNKNKEKYNLASRQYGANNKESIAKNKKEYYEKNKERIKEQKRQAIKNATEEQKLKERFRSRVRGQVRRKKTGNHMSIKIIRDLLIQYKHKCYYCNIKINDKEKNSFHIDHYIPLSKGGTNEVHNLVIACPTCNMSKGAKMPEEFVVKLGRLL